VRSQVALAAELGISRIETAELHARICHSWRFTKSDVLRLFSEWPSSTRDGCVLYFDVKCRISMASNKIYLDNSDIWKDATRRPLQKLDSEVWDMDAISILFW
jgi:hypothetical protein